MLKLVTTYCLTFIASLAFAQTTDTFKVSGTVISANSGELIPDGTIMISRTKGYKCDSLGRFTIFHLTQGQHKLTFSAFGYDTKDTVLNIFETDIVNFNWPIYSYCWKYSTETALKDIQSKRPMVLLQSGIAPGVYSSDNKFEIKYQISFREFGCVVADRQECLIAYNRTIFDYLDKTYGKKWRREIRRDAIGLRNK